MLTMPSVSSASNLVSRPALVAEVVRPATPPRAIEPTTAVSKERSRTDSKAPEASAVAVSALYSPTGKNKAADLTSGTNPGVSYAAEEALDEEQPPAEKSEIQKAMEAQIKELLINVWKASAKAVDFLLQRGSDTVRLNPLTTLQPAELLGKKANAVVDGADTSVLGAVISYDAQGGRLSDDAAATGQLLDVLA